MRGVTLIELMISVALIGISVGTAGYGVRLVQEASSDIASRERARQCLDYESNAWVQGTPARAEARAKLLAEVPGGRFHSRVEGELTRMEVEWRSSRGTETEKRVLMGAVR